MTPFKLAYRYLDIREFPGGVDNPLIQWWLLRAGLPHGSHDEVPWCGAFMDAVMWECGARGPAFPARARHWLTAGTPVALQDAKPGWDVVILKRGDGWQPGSEVLNAPGHVGLFDKESEGRVWLLGGNQGDRVSVKSFPVDLILGIRRLGAGEV